MLSSPAEAEKKFNSTHCSKKLATTYLFTK